MTNVPDAPVMPSAPAPTGPDEASRDDVTPALVRAVARLIRIPWQFRNEFIGQTIMQPPETEFLYDDPEVVHERLLGDSVRPPERARRLECLRHAVDAVALHQIVMLDGYKASVTTGADQLLDALNPDTVRTAVRAENPLYRWIPPLAAPPTLKRLTQQHAELRSGAWSVAEHRIFRPAFIKSYLARMTAIVSPEAPPAVSSSAGEASS